MAVRTSNIMAARGMGSFHTVEIYLLITCIAVADAIRTVCDRGHLSEIEHTGIMAGSH